MHLKLLALSASVLSLASPALALSSSPDPSAAPPAATTAAPPEPCQPVKFVRPDVDLGKNHFMIVLRKGDVSAIRACNPGMDIHQISAGIGVVITYGPDGAVVNLPTSLTADSASNGRCINDATGNLVDQVLYTGEWSDGLPDHVELQKLDPAYYDKPAQLAICKRMMEAHKYNE
ncbi:MAG TPA: hypothetical protein VMU25_04825 [Candidatus Paceibacterota bacterium]|nr:hypothetical protein [Candidatus Paceibacterota bacterium]